MLRISSTGYRDVQNYLDSLKLTPGKRKQLHRALARKVAGYARRNVRSQTEVDGGAFQARAPQNPDYDSGKKRGKMLQRLAREKHMKAIGEDQFGKVYWKDGWLGSVAKRQQEGARLDMQAERERRGRNRNGGDGWGNDPATKSQAKRLVSLGFKRRVKGRGYLKASPAWIRKNMTIHHAGLLIRILGGRSAAMQRFANLPSRTFLGVSPRENAELRDIIIDLLLRYR